MIKRNSKNLKADLETNSVIKGSDATWKDIMGMTINTRAKAGDAAPTDADKRRLMKLMLDGIGWECPGLTAQEREHASKVFAKTPKGSSARPDDTDWAMPGGANGKERPNRRRKKLNMK